MALSGVHLHTQCTQSFTWWAEAFTQCSFGQWIACKLCPSSHTWRLHNANHFNLTVFLKVSSAVVCSVKQPLLMSQRAQSPRPCLQLSPWPSPCFPSNGWLNKRIFFQGDSKQRANYSIVAVSDAFRTDAFIFVVHHLHLYSVLQNFFLQATSRPTFWASTVAPPARAMQATAQQPQNSTNVILLTLSTQMWECKFHECIPACTIVTVPNIKIGQSDFHPSLSIWIWILL